MTAVASTLNCRNIHNTQYARLGIILTVVRFIACLQPVCQYDSVAAFAEIQFEWMKFRCGHKLYCRLNVFVVVSILFLLIKLESTSIELNYSLNRVCTWDPIYNMCAFYFFFLNKFSFYEWEMIVVFFLSQLLVYAVK